jgi:hypothetical protein
MNERYFVISNSDGETTVTELSKEQLLKRVNDGEYKKVLSVPDNEDTNYWGDNVMIIKGTIVKPRAEQVVTKYSID